jgi:GntR family transcriptional regulator
MRACFALQQNRKFLDKQYKTVDNSSMLLYTVYNKGGMNLNIIISNSSMQPIYEQIVTQVKAKIMNGELKEQTMLPSVRTLAKEIKVSALTVKKAYDALDEEGFIVTVHGKGSFVTLANQGILLEEKKKEVEADFDMAIRKGRSCGMSDQELTELFQIVLED